MRHADPGAFLAAATPLLASDPAAQVFITSWVDGWRTQTHLQPAVYAATCTLGESRGLALQREGPVIVANSRPDAAAALARDLAEVRPALHSVIGESVGCEAFAEAWSRCTGCAWRSAMRLRHHLLVEPRDVPRAPGAMRPADGADLPWLTQHALAFAREAELPDSPRQVETSVARRFARNGFRIWTDPLPVAFAGYIDVGSDARIGMVYTLRDRRRRGYATSLVASIVRERIAAGVKRVFLTTDVANPTSNAVYARIGFRPVGDEVRIDFVARSGT